MYHTFSDPDELLRLLNRVPSAVVHDIKLKRFCDQAQLIVIDPTYNWAVNIVLKTPLTVWGSISGPVKSCTVSPPLRECNQDVVSSRTWCISISTI